MTLEKINKLTHMVMKRWFTLTTELQLGQVMDNFHEDGTFILYKKTSHDYDVRKSHF